MLTSLLDDLPSLAPLYDVEDANESCLPSPSPSIQDPTSDDNVPHTSLAGLHKVYHLSRSVSQAGGRNLLQQIDKGDEFATVRAQYDVHYPFSSRADWQLANWLTCAPLPQSEVNSFLRLDYVCNLFCYCRLHLTLYQVKQNVPSFTSAQDLRNCIEGLPEVPRWSH
jgi:hypothetical protein